MKLVPRLDAAKLKTVPDVFEVLYLFAVLEKMDAFMNSNRLSVREEGRLVHAHL